VSETNIIYVRVLKRRKKIYLRKKTQYFKALCVELIHQSGLEKLSLALGILFLNDKWLGDACKIIYVDKYIETFYIYRNLKLTKIKWHTCGNSKLWLTNLLAYRLCAKICVIDKRQIQRSKIILTMDV
jgi:hypothetical protein